MMWRGPMGGSAASGKIGAMIAGHCAQGQYLKSRVKPVNPRSPLQAALRNAMKSLMPTWQEVLTGSQRAAWATYAANVTWLNRLGDTIHLSGQMEFFRSNAPRLQAGVPLVLDAPVIFNRGSIGTAPTLTLTPADLTATLTYDPAGAWIDGSNLTDLMLYIGIPRSPGITFMAKRARFAGFQDAMGATGTTLFIIPWLSGITYNQVIPSWVTCSFADGRLTTPMQLAPIRTGAPPLPPFIDDFTYPDGPLAGNGDWTVDAGPDPDPTVDTHAITSTTAQTAWAVATNSSIPRDSTAAMHCSITFNTPLTGPAAETQISGGIASNDNPDAILGIRLDFQPGDYLAGTITTITAVDAGGTILTAAAVPFDPALPHVASVTFNGTSVILWFDGAPLTFTPATLAGTPAFFFINISSFSTGVSPTVDRVNMGEDDSPAG